MIKATLNFLMDLATAGFYWQKPFTPKVVKAVRKELASALDTVDIFDPDQFATDTLKVRRDWAASYQEETFHLIMFTRPWLLLTYREKLMVNTLHKYLMQVFLTKYENASDFKNTALGNFDESFDGVADGYLLG